MKERIRIFSEYIKKQNKNVLVVAHGASSRMLLFELANLDSNLVYKRYSSKEEEPKHDYCDNIENASVSMIEDDEIVFFNKVVY